MKEGIGLQLANHLFDMKDALQDAPIGLTAAGVYLEHHTQALAICRLIEDRELEAMSDKGNPPISGTDDLLQVPESPLSSAEMERILFGHSVIHHDDRVRILAAYKAGIVARLGLVSKLERVERQLRIA